MDKTNLKLTIICRMRSKGNAWSPGTNQCFTVNVTLNLSNYTGTI